MSRIPATFNALKKEHRKALIPFITAGDPEPAATVELMHAMAAAGADLIELGVPFSDPMADGPAIQRSSERALKHDVSLKRVLEMVAEFRTADAKTPVVLMGYANPIEAMGYEAFAAGARQSGVDGIIVVDYPPEEWAALAGELGQREIDAIFLLSPTTTAARIEHIARYAQGYIYYVSLRGVTGAANLDVSEIAAKLPQIRKQVKLPIGVGFGIRDPQTARAVANIADAVVIGTRVVQEIENSPRERVADNIGALIRSFRNALDS